MPPLILRSPNWTALPGGTTEGEWIADRDRKFGITAEFAKEYIDLFQELNRRRAVFHCSPEILQDLPGAAEWYISLAGFSLKTLGNIRERPRRFGLTRTAKGLVKARRNESMVLKSQLQAFSDWINDEIDGLFPERERNEELAFAVVMEMVGGRALGQGQNIGGDVAVILLKSLLVESVLDRGGKVEVLEDGEWVAFRPEMNLQRQRLLRVDTVTINFTGGGDRPDILAEREDGVIAVGEIKGRKDTSNVWESWMPQVADHMTTWASAYPDAARLFFGTLISKAMIEGESARGTRRAGLRSMHERGDLTSAYNLSLIEEGQEEAVEAFEDLISAVTDPRRLR
jgi:hypothetical protein